MRRYVIAENIRRFTALLEQERDPHQRGVLEALLHQEQLKLRALDQEPDPKLSKPAGA